MKLTRYEKARIIGARALQISQGAPLLVPAKGMMDPISIALKEFKAGKITINIERPKI